MAPPDPSRRNPAVRAAILQAATELCQEVGLAKLTVEGVARRAGAGKQTLYRWWPSVAAVLLEAIGDAGRQSRGFPDTGDVRADLRTQMRALVQLMNSPAMAPYTGLIAAAQSDPLLRRALLGQLIEPRVSDCAARLAKAQADGQIRDDVDLVAVVELLYGPFYYRLLLHSDKISNRQVDTILDLAFTGITARSRSTSRAATSSD